MTLLLLSVHTFSFFLLLLRISKDISFMMFLEKYCLIASLYNSIVSYMIISLPMSCEVSDFGGLGWLEVLTGGMT